MAQEDGQDIDLLLASLRADASDGHAFLQALAVKLDGALPGQVKIDRHGGVFSHDKSVKRVEIDVGQERYSIAEEGHGALRANKTRIVRGIALKTEDLGVDEWIRGLAGDLSELAQSSSNARQALERLLLGR